MKLLKYLLKAVGVTAALVLNETNGDTIFKSYHV